MCDSPGYCAKYDTDMILDERTNQILDFSVVQITQVTSSNAMEAEGCNQRWRKIKKEYNKVDCLTSNTHITISSDMKKKHPEIEQLDNVWHLRKWVVKKLTRKGVRNNCNKLISWIQVISWHFWWSVSTYEGVRTSSLKTEIQLPTTFIGNRCFWREDKVFNKCAHHNLVRYKANKLAETLVTCTCCC